MSPCRFVSSFDTILVSILAPFWLPFASFQQVVFYLRFSIDLGSFFAPLYMPRTTFSLVKQIVWCVFVFFGKVTKTLIFTSLPASFWEAFAIFFTCLLVSFLFASISIHHFFALLVPFGSPWHVFLFLGTTFLFPGRIILFPVANYSPLLTGIVTAPHRNCHRSSPEV